MKLKEIGTRITKTLADKLTGTGFATRNAYLLARERGGSQEQIQCSIRRDRTSGTALISLMLGLRFEQVEQVLARMDLPPDVPTVALPIERLFTDQKNTEWDASNPETMDELLTQIETYALPFFDKYHILDNVVVALQSQNARDWFTETPDSRVETLSAFLAARGKVDSALELLDREIALRQNDSLPPTLAVRRRLQNLRGRILALSN